MQIQMQYLKVDLFQHFMKFTVSLVSLDMHRHARSDAVFNLKCSKTYSVHHLCMLIPP